MKHNSIKFMWLVCGIILVFAGIVALFNPSGAISAIAYVLALALLLSGIAQIIVFATTHDTVFGNIWVLLEGLLNILIAVLLLCNRFLAEAAIPAIFGMWLMVSGITRTIFSIDLRKLDMSGWGWMLLVGILCILVGFFSFFHPFVAGMALGILVGILFILQGILSILVWIYAMRRDF